MFFFIYNKDKNKNLDSNLNIKEFSQQLKVTIEYITYTINFITLTRLDKTLNYNFKLHSKYLIDNKRKSVFIFGIKNFESNK